MQRIKNSSRPRQCKEVLPDWLDWQVKVKAIKISHLKSNLAPIENQGLLLDVKATQRMKVVENYI